MPGWAGSQGKEDPSVATDGEHGARQGHGAGCPHGACGWHRGCAAASPSRTPPCAGPPGADLLLPALSPHFEVSANSEFAFPASTCTIGAAAAGCQAGAGRVSSVCPHHAAPAVSPALSPSFQPNHTRCKVRAASSEQQQPEQQGLFLSLPSRSLPSAGDKRAPGPARCS